MIDPTHPFAALAALQPHTDTPVDAAASDESQAPAKSAAQPRTPGERRHTPAKARPAGAAASRPARPVHPALQQLFTLYPKLFGARFLPLKLGVFQDLLALHPTLFKRDELKVALGLHARSTRYLESVATGAPRHDLEGQVVEPVAPEHVHHAIMEVFRRRQGRTSQDLRPYAQAQLVSAIDACGLNREEYVLCVRQLDDAALALLDGAFTEINAQAAKRDALLRTFEASGKTEAEFADMYGLQPSEVSDTIAQARQALLKEQARQAARDAAPAVATESDAVDSENALTE